MKTVFVDVDTQLDFLYPAGSLYVPGAGRLVPAAARLNRYAAEHGIPVISTTDAHTEDDPEFRIWPHHCVAGTWGQRKAESTLLASRVVIPNRLMELPGLAGQIIVEKQTIDVFQAVNLPRLLDALGDARYVVYGVVTEICVLSAALGLLRRTTHVTVVRDAVETLDAANSAAALAQIESAGGRLASLAEVTG